MFRKQRLGVQESKARSAPAIPINAGSALSELKEVPDFSLGVGGPLFKVYRKLNLGGDPLELLYRRMIDVPPFAWARLLLLSLFFGGDKGGPVGFFRDIAVHVRALPALILAEVIVHNGSVPFVKRFSERKLIKNEDLPKFIAAAEDVRARLCCRGLRTPRGRRGMSAIRIWIVILLGVSTIFLSLTTCAGQEYTRESSPEIFSYDELVQLSLDKPMSPQLQQKLVDITTTPFVNNEAYFQGAKPRTLEIEGLGPSLRVIFWNIERGLELDEIKLLLTDPKSFMARVHADRENAKVKGEKLRNVDLEKIPAEIEILRSADIWVLNEVDWGLKRTQYRKVVDELGQVLNMNWAYGVEFVEIDSTQLGTATFEDVKDQKIRQQLLNEFQVDKTRVKALHGNAVLSRYPIRSARLVPFTLGYDWFKERKIRPLEKAKRKAAVVVGEELLREMRRGQRTTLIVDLDIPEAPGGRFTLAATHMENRAKPKIRRLQLEQLLKTLHAVRNPVLIAGDLNTSGGDSTPTSIENVLYKRYGDLDFWSTKGVQWVTGLGLVYTGAKALRKLAGIQTRIDPTSKNIPGLSPNLEHGFFSTLEEFRFSDGTAFDFRGEPQRTLTNSSGTLGNSNMRKGRSFVPTFITQLIWGDVRVAKFKLDWIFVKSNLRHPRDPKGSYLFAPHFARTLGGINNSLREPISDHSPIAVDLPFRQPGQLVSPTKPD